MSKFAVGTKIEIINAGRGAMGANGKIGVVTDKTSRDGFLAINPFSFNVEVDNTVWRVGNDGEYVIISKPKDSSKTIVKIHKHRILPHTFNCIVTDDKGNLIQEQTVKRDNESYKVIYNGDTTVVIFEDGTKGVANKSPEDTYDIQIAHDLAYARANLKRLQKRIKDLENGIKPAERRISFNSVKYGKHEIL